MNHLKIYAVLLCLIIAAQSAFAQNNILDMNFAPTIEAGFLPVVSAIARQPDGKLLVGGSFAFVNDRPSYSLVRFNEDGSRDSTFQPLIYAFTPGIKSIAVLNDGKIIIGGYFFDPVTSEPINIARLNADGTFDETFKATTNAVVNAVAVQSDNKIIIGGVFTSVNGTFRQRLVRLNADGSFDNSFNYSANTVDALILQSDGKLIISEAVGNPDSTSTYKITRLQPNGTRDDSFAIATATGNRHRVRVLKLQTDGRIIFGGTFDRVNSSIRTGLARLNANGSVDENFNPILTAHPAPVLGTTFLINAIETDANGKILIGGDFSAVNGIQSNRIARLNNEDGSVDSSFTGTSGADAAVNAIYPYANGKIFVGGSFTKYNGEPRYRLVKLNSDGSTDASFSAKINSYGSVLDIEIQPDGKILAAGRFIYVDGSNYASIVRFLPDGTLDPTFATYNQIQFGGDLIDDIELQPDGKIIIVGDLYFRNNSTPYKIARLNSDGTIDTSFTPVSIPNFFPRTVKLQPNGQILVGGNGTNNVRPVIRLNANGSIDNYFIVPSTTPAVLVLDLAVRSDGKILIVGNFSAINSISKNNIALLNSDGSVDQSFTANANNSVSSIELLAGNSILVAGNFTQINNVARNRVAKLNALGQIDPTFDVSATVNLPIENIELLRDGRIILVGNGLVVLNTDGSIYASVPPVRGANDTIFDAAVQTDGRIIIGGQFTIVNNITRYGLARLSSVDSLAGKPLFDYDGDGRADIAVFRPSAGTWYVQNTSPNGYAAQQFGQNGDVIVPADYDGDGRTDYAVFRPSSGTWYRLNSATNNSFAFQQFGQSGDIPVPADYDGDGKADIAVYRPSSGSWYRLNSTNNAFFSVQFGAQEDKPVVGDFDGDGRADITVYRPSTGYWYRTNSSNNSFFFTQFGAPEDKPVAADYDGDGKADIAVYRPSSGYWYRLNSGSNNSFGFAQFGAAADFPAPADYDGDGRADLAVFRPSNGTWYLQRTTAGFTSVQFGQNGDVPVASAYVR